VPISWLAPMSLAYGSDRQNHNTKTSADYTNFEQKEFIGHQQEKSLGCFQLSRVCMFACKASATD